MYNEHEVIKDEAIQDIIECLENGYNGCYGDLHDEVFNTDYYVIGTDKAKSVLTNYDVFDAIELVVKYEKDNFGEICTDIADPEKLLNTVYYIIGDEVIMDILENVSIFEDKWNKEADEESNKIIINYLKEMN